MSKGGNPKEILVVEDSKAQAASLAEVLREEGYSVGTANDGAEALNVLATSRPDLIISDVWMPRLDGYALCRTLKGSSLLRDIPIVLLTSMSGFGSILKGLNAGADYYLTKPYGKDLLLSMVRSICSGSGRYNGAADSDIAGVFARDPATSPRQILNFLFSTHENLLYQNGSLAQARQQLRKLNDHLEKKVEEKTDSLQKILNGTVIALSRMVEIRDPYTAGHQLRVAQLAEAIAVALGLSQERSAGVRTMGLLHDIGKIIVPAEILCKPSRLNEYEFHFIKQHSRAGYDILQGVDFPWPVATAVLQHHERLDGSGYPAGLSGRDIIVEARILAVADVIESMASHRPYRPALGIDLALEEITSRKATLYDPDIADVAIGLLQERVFVFE